jgi:hypothetical protein
MSRAFLVAVFALAICVPGGRAGADEQTEGTAVVAPCDPTNALAGADPTLLAGCGCADARDGRLVVDRYGGWWREREVPNVDARTELIAGLALLGAGFTLAEIATLPATSSTAGDRVLDGVPIAGAIAAAARNDMPPSSRAALIFAAGTQVIGLLLTVSSATQPQHRIVRSRVSFGAAGFSDGAAATLSGTF